MYSIKADIASVKARLPIFMLVTMTGFFLVALALIFWSLISGPNILLRDDNPRLVEEELRVQRGSIVDRNKVTLVETIGEEDELQRSYFLEGVGPIVGYYSLRHGTSGIERSYDPLLRGDVSDFWSEFWRKSLHKNQVGRSVQLAIDARLQQLAYSMLDDEKGAVLLFSLPEAEIITLVSNPTFAPDELDEQFDDLVADEEAPLLNRVTQGQYQPGMVLQPFIIAYALNEGIISLDDKIEDADRPIVVNGTSIQCNEPVDFYLNWAEVLKYQCPGAMTQLGNRLGSEKLSEAFTIFGFMEPPILEIDTESGDESSISDIHLASIGQDNLSVSPLQVGMAMAALANGGWRPNAKLVLATEDPTGNWVPERRPPEGVKAMNPDVADDLLGFFGRDDEISEFPITVLSGPEGTTNAWYMGLASNDSQGYGIVVVIEEVDGPSTAQHIGRTLLREARNKLENLN